MIFRNTTAVNTFIPALPYVELGKVKLFKTNITTTKQRDFVLEVLSHIPCIEECWVDIYDSDYVFRVVGEVNCTQIKEIVSLLGFEINELN